MEVEARVSSFNDILYKGQSGGVVVRIAPGIVVKATRRNLSEEVLATRFAKTNTNIPVPRIYDVEPTSQQSFSMSECLGVTLESSLATLTAKEQEYVATQLKDIVDQMKKLPLPLGMSDLHLGSATGGPYSNLLFLSDVAPPTKAWTSMRDFNQYWFDILTDQGPEAIPYASMVIKGLPSDCSSVFSHVGIVTGPGNPRGYGYG